MKFTPIAILLSLPLSVFSQSFPEPNLTDTGDGWLEITVFGKWSDDQRLELRQVAEFEMLKYKKSVQIQEEVLDLMSEGSSNVNIFTSISSARVSGRIDSIYIIEETRDFIRDIPYRVIRFRGRVIQEEPDDSFQIDCELNANYLFNAQPLELRITSTKRAHPVVLNYDLEEDSFEILYPHGGIPYKELSAKDPFYLPPKGFHKKILVYADDQSEKRHTVFIVATKHEIILPNRDSLNFEGFKNWLSKIPLPARAITYRSYNVVKGK